ncbi:HlyD family efflux transporter periplasmic adaptor subunit [uncultured Roseobacter sp.]|uniref:efflux RND transporter periplasmic adaptor subunit n=1 Tax=uncultured Roseobacter sp. TaxID=114847 RepID=UPI002609A582|nr:HlyD family efflux transporter periplasmic adaptor subunit [uncultured Roseobacter sp.]
MRFLRQSMIGLFLAAVTLGLLAYAGQLVGTAIQLRLADQGFKPEAKERVFAVNLIRAEAQTLNPLLETFGEVKSRRTLELRAAVSGRVIYLAETFEEGGTVRKGDVLARINPADMQSVLDRAKADLADAQAEVSDAARALDLARDEEAAAVEQADLRQRAYRRQVDLEERGVGTAAAIETAELDAAAARATVLARRQAITQAEARIDLGATRLTRARIALEEAQRNLKDTTVRAPFDGTLSDTSVVEGRLVASNERLADLIDAEDLEVSFRVSTAQYARLLDAQGDLIAAPVTATLDVTGVDLQATGTLSRVSAATNEIQTGRLIFARLTKAPGFRPGDFVSLSVVEPPVENVVRLPASALNSQGEVLVLGDDNRLEAIIVTLVRRQRDDVLVRGEDLIGRDVVSAQTPLLGPGISVRATRRASEAPVMPPDMLELSEERRARLVAFVESSNAMSKEAKARVLAKLAEHEVSAKVVARLESRIGG